MKSVEGIILKKSPRREADAVITAYTKELGLMHFRARSVRKQTSKLRSGLNVFNWSEIYFAPSRHLPIITETKTQNSLAGIKSNLYRLKLAQAAALVLSEVIVPGVADERIWREVSGLFLGLNDKKLSHPELENRAYVFCHNLLVLNGLMPRLAGSGAAADLRREVQDFFGYHFGIELAKLL